MGALCAANATHTQFMLAVLCCVTFFYCVLTHSHLFYSIKSVAAPSRSHYLLAAAAAFFKLPFRLGVNFSSFSPFCTHMHSMHRHTDIPILVFFHSKLVRFSKTIHTCSWHYVGGGVMVMVCTVCS